jgi:hypothetical protein
MPRHYTDPTAILSRDLSGLAKRFWAKVRKTDDCWIWEGAATPLGYGVIRCGLGKESKNLYTTRVGWFLTHGYWPKADLCHKCDNPPCVRPDHLFEGTPKDNRLDAMRKGRLPIGENNGQSKLTPQQVAEIRRLYSSGKIGHNQLASKFGVSNCTISHVVRRLRWKHVD